MSMAPGENDDVELKQEYGSESITSLPPCQQQRSAGENDDVESKQEHGSESITSLPPCQQQRSAGKNDDVELKQEYGSESITSLPPCQQQRSAGKNDDVELKQEHDIESIRPSSFLPPDIVGMILARMSVKEAVVLSYSCKSWRATAPLYDPTLRKTPWMFRAKNEFCYQLCSADKQQWLTLPFLGFSPRADFCHGSWHGWLLLSKKTCDRPPVLFNPFSRARIDLPLIPLIHAEELTQPFLVWACLSAPPTDPDCVLLARFYRQITTFFLLVWRPGDSSWTAVENPFPPVNITRVWIKGRGFFAFQPNNRRLTSLPFHAIKFTSLDVTTPVHVDYDHIYFTLECSHDNSYYLVEYSGDILFVAVQPWIYKIDLFRINPDEGESWVEVESIGDQALFLGEKGDGFLLTAAESGCLSNCIYLFRGWQRPPYWRVYSLEVKSFLTFFMDETDFSHFRPRQEYGGLHWIMPSSR